MQHGLAEDPAFKDHRINNVLVIGVAENESGRRRYEDLFVKRMKEVGITAAAGYELMPQEKQLTETEIEASAKSAGADTILITRIIDEKDRIQYSGPVSYPSHYGNYYGYYGFSYSAMHSPGYATQYVETFLESNLYDTKSKKLIWSGQKSVTDFKSVGKNMELVVATIIKDLQKQGMITSK